MRSSATLHDCLSINLGASELLANALDLKNSLIGEGFLFNQLIKKRIKKNKETKIRGTLHRELEEEQYQGLGALL